MKEDIAKKEDEDIQGSINGIKGLKDLYNTVKQLFEEKEVTTEEFLEELKNYRDEKEKSEQVPFIQIPSVCETQEPIVINNYGTINIIDGKNFRVIDKLFEGDNEGMVD